MADISNETIDRTVHAARLLAGVLALSVLMYMGVPWIVASIPVESAPESADRSLVYGLLALAAVLILASGSLGRLALSGASERGNASARGRYFLSVMVTFVVLELSAVCGMVAALIAHQPLLSVAVGALTLLRMGASWPSTETASRVFGR